MKKMKRLSMKISSVLVTVLCLNMGGMYAADNNQSRALMIDACITIEDKAINALADGKADTVYNVGGSVVDIDLGAEYSIDSISIRHDYDKVLRFTVESSSDDENWENAADYEHSNLISETFGVKDDVNARYLKIRFFTEDIQCSEIEVYKKGKIVFNSGVEVEEDTEPRLYINEFADAKGYPYEQECEFLAALGIINGKQEGVYGGGDYLTRAEFAKIMVNTLNVRLITAGEPIFTDLDLSDPLSDYVYTAYENGLVSGYGDGRFGPNDNVLYQEACVMLCRLLNYDKKIYKNDNYPSNYIQALSSEMSLKRVSGAYSQPLTRGNAAILVYEALNAKPFEIDEISAKGVKYSGSEDTLLQITREIDVRQGILEAVEQSGIYTIPETADEMKETLVIGGRKYEYDIERLSPDYFIGSEIKYYIDTRDDEERCIFMLPGKNEINIVEYDFDDLYNIQADCIKTNDNKRIKISNDAMIMYNGVSYGLYKSLYNVINENACGIIRLIDSNDDNTYDLVRYMAYVNDEVKIADETTGILQTDSARIDLNDSSIVCNIFYGNSKADISKIENDDILSLSKSTNDKGIVYYEIHIGRNRIKNTVINLYESEDNEITADGTTYKLAAEYSSPGVANSVTTGQNVDLIMDGYSRVHKIVSVSSEGSVWTYAFLTKVYEKEENTDEGEIRVVGLDASKHDIPCEFPITVENGENKVRCTQISELYETISNNNGGELAQLIKYITNSNGKVKRIETAYDGENTKYFSLDYKSGSARYKWAVSEWDYNAKVNDNTKYLIVPDDITDYSKYKVSPILNGEDGYNIKCYDKADNRAAAVIVMYGENGSYISENDNNLFICESVRYGLDSDDNQVRILSGYKNGKKLTFEEPTENAFANVKVGDLMQVVLDAEGKVFRYKLVTPVSSTGDETCDRLTTVEDIKGTEIKDSWRWFEVGNIHIYIVENNRSKLNVHEGSMGDIEIGDKVMVSIRHYYPDMVVVYKD